MRKPRPMALVCCVMLSACGVADTTPTVSGGPTYLDVGGAFLEADGTISNAVMYDFLHPTALGYQRWAAAMGPALDRLMKP